MVAVDCDRARPSGCPGSGAGVPTRADRTRVMRRPSFVQAALGVATAALVAGASAPASAAPGTVTAPAAPGASSVATHAAAGALAAGPRTTSIATSRGHDGVCTSSRGVSVVVDFQQLGGSTLRRCALPDPGQTRFSGTGLDSLRAAKIDLEGVDRWGLGFICRIAGKPAATTTLTLGGAPYKERCVDTPPAAAYWSYWHTSGKRGPWTYSQYGVKNRLVVNGGYEGWSFSLGRTASSNPPPRVTPAVAPSTAKQPYSAATPTISGTAKVGSTLRASTGTWSPRPTKTSYRWYRDGVAIAGAWSSTYKASSADRGRTLCVMVTGSGTGRATTWSTSAARAVAS